MEGERLLASGDDLVRWQDKALLVPQFHAESVLDAQITQGPVNR